MKGRWRPNIDEEGKKERREERVMMLGCMTT